MTTISQNEILDNAKAGTDSHAQAHAHASRAPTGSEVKVVGQMAALFVRPRNAVRGL